METLALEISNAYEVERGKPMPSKNHGIVQANAVFELKTRYRDQFRFASEINIEVGGRVMVPDIGIFAKMSVDMDHDEIVLTQLPLTTIEILSPRQALDELVDKATAYLAAGVKSCWIISPKTLGIFVGTAPGKFAYFSDDQTLTDPATGIEMPLAPLFE